MKMILTGLFSTLVLLSALVVTSPAAGADAEWPPAPPSNCALSDGRVYAAWTQIVGNDERDTSGEPYPLRGLVRAVVDGAGSDCSSLRVAYTTSSNGARQYASGFAARANPNTARFPVTTCEMAMSATWQNTALYQSASDGPRLLDVCQPGTDGSISYAAADLPSLYDVGRRNSGELRMVSTADTGCRDCVPPEGSGLECGSNDKNEQSCSPESWPYLAVTTSMVSKVPDLVIHGGDYRYRGQDIPEDPKGSSDYQPVDTWDDWYKDFFYPSLALLRTSPWAMARGNHEVCSGSKDAGPGWFYFLDQKPVARQRDCDTSIKDRVWYFDVAIKATTNGTVTASAPHRFIVLDTSDDSDNTSRNFKVLDELADVADDTAWWVMHRPVWGISTDTDNDSGVKTRTGDLQDDLHDALGSRGSKQADCNPAANNNGWLGGVWSYDGVSCHMRSILAGHSHLMVTAKFYADEGATSGVWQRPSQLIVGNGGVELDPALDASPCSIDIDKLTSTIQWGGAWSGYLYAVREGDIATTGKQSGWDLERVRVSGSFNDTASRVDACSSPGT